MITSQKQILYRFLCHRRRGAFDARCECGTPSVPFVFARLPLPFFVGQLVVVLCVTVCERANRTLFVTGVACAPVVWCVHPFQ